MKPWAASRRAVNQAWDGCFSCSSDWLCAAPLRNEATLQVGRLPQHAVSWLLCSELRLLQMQQRLILRCAETRPPTRRGRSAKVCSHSATPVAPLHGRGGLDLCRCSADWGLRDPCRAADARPRCRSGTRPAQRGAACSLAAPSRPWWCSTCRRGPRHLHSPSADVPGCLGSAALSRGAASRPCPAPLCGIWLAS